MSFEAPQPKEKININWAYPDVAGERGEVERTAKDFSASEKEYPIMFSNILKAIDEANFQDLPETLWSELENTESYDVKQGDIESVKNFSVEKGRDWEKILNGMKNGYPMQAPIIVIKKDGTPYLVSGNTRLMLARALGAKVQVVIARL